LNELRLRPLDAAASRDVILAISRQHGCDIREEYVDWCINVAEGNPYFLQELANQFIDRGDAHGVPSSLTAVLNGRIARLSDDALLVLQTAAVLERNSTFELIERTVGFEAHKMLRAVDELGVAGMLQIESGDRAGAEANRITSRHDLLSNAALAKLTAPARAFLHRRAGTVIEQEIDEGRSASALWDCAKHWQLAGDSARALRLAKTCATHAMDVGLPAAAAEAYERALTFCLDPHDRLSVLIDLATAYHRSEAWAELRKAIPQLRELQRQLTPAAPSHDDLELMGIRAEWRYNLTESPVSQALACLGDQTASDDHRFRAGGLALMMLDHRSRQDEMDSVYATIEKLSERAGTSSPAYLEASMVYHTICGSLPAAADAARRFLAQQRQRGNQGDLSRNLLNVARVLRTAGYADEAYSLMREGEALSSEYRLPHAARFELPTLANWEMEKGDIAAAEAWYEKLVSVSQGEKTPYERRDLATVGARVALCKGNPRLARRRFATTLDEILQTQTGQLLTYELAVFVAIDLLQYRISQRAVEALEKSYLHSRRNCAQGFAVVVLCEALKHCKQGKRAAEILHEYVNHFRREILPLGPGTARLFDERLDRRRIVVIRA